jgi:hypothetical protein
MTAAEQKHLSREKITGLGAMANDHKRGQGSSQTVVPAEEGEKKKHATVPEPTNLIMEPVL